MNNTTLFTKDELKVKVNEMLEQRSYGREFKWHDARNTMQTVFEKVEAGTADPLEVGAALAIAQLTIDAFHAHNEDVSRKLRSQLQDINDVVVQA